MCHRLTRDQPQPGSFFQRPREAEKKDPGNEVGRNSDDHERRDRIHSNSVSHGSTQVPSEAGAEGNSIVALPCEICGELCPSDRLMKHQEECSQENGNTVDPTASRRQRNSYDSNLPHFRFWSAQRNSPNRHNVEDSFVDFTFMGSPYYILANVFRDLEERRRPFEMMRNL